MSQAEITYHSGGSKSHMDITNFRLIAMEKHVDMMEFKNYIAEQLGTKCYIDGNILHIQGRIKQNVIAQIFDSYHQ